VPVNYVPIDLQDRAKRVVLKLVKDRLDKSDPEIEFDLANVFVVWFAKTLGNWKALVSTTLPDGKYYELTYNGGRSELYVDTYVKVDNVCLQADELDHLG
jgi:hypothetical protein